METLYEPFPMIDYTINSFNINFMDIGREDEHFGWDIGWMNQWFKPKSMVNTPEGRFDSNNDEDSQSDSSKKSKRWKCWIF